MGRTDDARLERIETRLVRLGQASDILDLLAFRLGQISRRAPYLKTLSDAACADALQALALVREEFEDTKDERASKT